LFFLFVVTDSVSIDSGSCSTLGSTSLGSIGFKGSILRIGFCFIRAAFAFAGRAAPRFLVKSTFSECMVELFDQILCVCVDERLSLNNGKLNFQKWKLRTRKNGISNSFSAV